MTYCYLLWRFCYILLRSNRLVTVRKCHTNVIFCSQFKVPWVAPVFTTIHVLVQSVQVQPKLFQIDQKCLVLSQACPSWCFSQSGCFTADGDTVSLCQTSLHNMSHISWVINDQILNLFWYSSETDKADENKLKINQQWIHCPWTVYSGLNSNFCYLFYSFC